MESCPRAVCAGLGIDELTRDQAWELKRYTGLMPYRTLSIALLSARALVKVFSTATAARGAVGWKPPQTNMPLVAPGVLERVCIALPELYEHGHATPLDYVFVYVWYARTDAADELHDVAKKMSITQIADAQRRVQGQSLRQSPRALPVTIGTAH